MIQGSKVDKLVFCGVVSLPRDDDGGICDGRMYEQKGGPEQEPQDGGLIEDVIWNAKL